jgi:hypothetical protein
VEKRAVAGILLIVGFIANLVQAMMIFIIGAEVSAFPGGGDAESVLYICATIELIFGIFAIVGAAMALSGKSWGLALVGSIFCLLSLGFMLIGSLMGLIALILIAISKDEFEGQAPAYAPAYGAPPYGQYGAPPPPMYGQETQVGYQQPYQDEQQQPPQYPPY